MKAYVVTTGTVFGLRLAADSASSDLFPQLLASRGEV
jgi:hypothetical protein